MVGTLKDWARAIKRDVHAIYLAARDPRVPWYAKALALCVAGYALSPIDLIPDFIPVIGYLDDLVIVPLGILAVVKLIPPEIMAEHRATAAIASERPISRVAAVVIVLLWIGSMALVGWLIYRHFAASGLTPVAVPSLSPQRVMRPPRSSSDSLSFLSSDDHQMLHVRQPVSRGLDCRSQRAAVCTHGSRRSSGRLPDGELHACTPLTP